LNVTACGSPEKFMTAKTLSCSLRLTKLKTFDGVLFGA
jgi:hypothetical protein